MKQPNALNVSQCVLHRWGDILPFFSSQGYAVKGLTQDDADLIATLNGVSLVEPNWVARIAQSCPTFPSLSWGLSRSVVRGRIVSPPQVKK